MDSQALYYASGLFSPLILLVELILAPLCPELPFRLNDLSRWYCFSLSEMAEENENEATQVGAEYSGLQTAIGSRDNLAKDPYF
ncbi:hypothetical protein EYR41_011897 [Orbilia oligospora]|uniref:Uncharacterized protein n=1 Tax=Orbilia oligospora TaxID=2813651 RepID=A0A7C8PCQ9_ORBOL|nr:hypothetical protein TWF751_008190 [Orbilia oligospora]TGJ62709.1 hypothetical protein EYR41_011897 [Orbilia oligospora]